MRIRPLHLFILVLLALVLAGPARAATVNAVWNSAADVPVVSSGYTATGNTVNFTLNYAPTAGTTLMVVKNTGLAFIQGTFNNLPQGQAVALTFGGSTYNFVANYYGGTGNDLVLQWAATSPVAWGFNNNGQLGNNSTNNSLVPAAVTTSGVLAGKTIIAVAAGSDHSLALCSDGTLAAWGFNSYGQLGNNSTTSSQVPVTVTTSGVLAGKTIVAVAVGSGHSLALCSDGTVAAWGHNDNGQLGNNSTLFSLVPVAVNTSDGTALASKAVVAVAAGSSHSLALCSDGTVAAWGYNAEGELGNNSTTQSNVPAVVNTSGVLAGKTVIAVAAGGNHSLVLCSDGMLAAWGFNISGELGGSSPDNSSVPVAVNASAGSALFGKTVIAVAAGGTHSLALCSDGTVAAWGNNFNGELGNGSSNNNRVPVAVTTSGVLSGKTVIVIAAGEYHSLAQCADGTLAAWGFNLHGELGNNSNTDSHVPVAVSAASLPTASRFAFGASGGSSFHSLWLVAVGPVIGVQQPAGTNLASGSSTVNFGNTNVGTGALVSFTIRNNGGSPLAISGMTIDGANSADFAVTTAPASSVAPGASTTMVVTFTPAVMSSRSAALHISSSDPSTGVFDVNLTGLGTGALSATFNSAASVPLTAASLIATGSTVNFTLNYAPTAGTTLMVVKNTGLGFIQGTFGNLAQGQAVALTFGGNTYNFVANYYGGTGNDLVLLWAGTSLVAWGDNSGGTLGNNSTVNLSVPVVVVASGVLSGKTVMAVSAGLTHSLALCSDGTLAAWGNNSVGQLGTSSFTNTSVPVVVGPAGAIFGRTVVAVSAGFSHSLALCSDGTVAAWGYNNFGQLGNNSTTQSNVPVAVDTSGVLFGKTVIALGAGGNHSLALCSDGTLASWGVNASGQLGNNSTTDSHVPVAVFTSGVLAGKTIIAVSAGQYHSLALCSDGTVAAWGYNPDGELGNNSTTQSNVPVAVNTSAGSALAGKMVIAVSAGTDHNLALCSDGTVVAWGSSGYGQLGNNSTTTSKVPVAANTSAGSALAGRTVSAVSAGSKYSLALCSDGTLATWGRNDNGELGNNSTVSSSVPVAVSTASLVAAQRFVLAASGDGADHTLGLVTGAPPTNANLASLALNAGTLAPGFASGTASYTASVPYSTFSITVTPTLADTAATVKVNGVPVNSGSANGAISLAVGANTITTVVSASDGVTTNTYTVVVTRAAPSTNANLSNLVVTAGTLTPGFDSATTDYAESVLNSVSSITVKPTTADSTATITVNGVAVASGTASSAMNLNVGPNTISTVVTAQDGTTSKTYSLVVTRAPSTNANLANLALSVGSLAPAFASGTTGYTASVSSAVSSITVTPTLADTTAAVKVNGVTVNSGSPSSAISLAVGNTTITTVVTAQDGATTNTYIVVVTRPGIVNVNATYNSAADVPVVSNGYTATGNTVNFTLNYVPTAGTTLMVVKNTGVGFIQGTFSNLAQGQVVTLTFGGNTYNFVANYYGGTGNDLVLVWATATSPMAWGLNTYGQLGNNGTANSGLPVAVTSSGVLAGKTITAMSTGASFSVVLCADGTVATCGNGAGGNSSVPVAMTNSGVLAGKTVVAVTAGGSHALALCSDGTVAAWGFNGFGQFGNNTTVSTSTPVAVSTSGALAGKTVVAISAGEGHSLALCSDGTLAAWGYNTDGELGNNSTTQSNVPVAVNKSGVLSGKTVAAVTAGGYHNLALCSDGTLVAWGRNSTGQLGNNSKTQSNVPVAVTTSGVLAGKTVVAISAGGTHSLALCSDGLLAAWGSNIYGQLGNNSTTQSSVPVGVTTTGVLSGRTVTAVSGGNNHSLAVCSDGTLAAWGYNTDGELGNNGTVQSTVPVAVSTIPAGVGRSFAFVLAASGSSSFHTLGIVVPSNSVFSNTGALNGARTSQVTVLLGNGKVLVAGGINGSIVATAELYDPATGAWTNTGSLNTARYDATGTLLPNGKVLVAGGLGAAALDSAELYDPATGLWTATGSLHTARYTHTAVLLATGQVLVAGGLGSAALNSAELYDPASGTWTLINPLNTARYFAAAALLPSGKVLVAGGRSPGTLSSGEIYDPAAGTWTATAGNLNTARYFHTMTLLPNGKVLAAGGSNGLTVIPSAELFDPALGTWAVTGAMTVARDFHSATLLPNGKVLVAAGIGTTAELYDYTAGTWTATNPLSAAHAHHAAVLLPGGKVLISGGAGTTTEYYFDPAAAAWTGSGALPAVSASHTATLLPNGKVLAAGGSNGSPTNAAGLYDPVARTWSATGSLSMARTKHTATLLTNGKILVVGGSGAGNSPLATAELYDPAGGAWSAAGTLSSARYSHTATLLANGKVLVAGGFSVAGYTLTTEIYDPAAGTWASTGNLHAGRREHTATLLPNGKVLAAGGASAGGALNSAELYDPSAGSWTAINAMNFQHQGGMAAVLPNGSVLLAGGNGSSGSASTELYTPSTGVWTATGFMSAGRVYFTATVLPNGNVLAVGGQDFSNSSYPTSGEEYDPAVGAWIQVAPLSVARNNHTATLLPDGTILVAGGFNATDSYLSSSVLFNIGLGYNAAWRPQVTTATSPLNPGGSLTIGGSGFKGISAGSGGGFQDSPSNYPVVQLRALEGGQSVFLPSNPAANWSNASFASVAVNGFPYGYALATVFANGIPGVSSIVDVTAVSSNAHLSNLVLSTGTLTPVFASGTTAYAAMVPDVTGSITVTPTVADSTATVTVGGMLVASGTSSGSISLIPGGNTINAVVTAQDGVTIQTYSVAVTRLTNQQTWRLTYFNTPNNSGNAADNYDYAHDGVANLLKYALGLNPTLPSGQLPQPVLSGNTLSITVTQPPGVNGITYGAEWTGSLNPANWTPVPDTGSGTTHFFGITVDSNPSGFLRLKVTNP